MESPTGAQVLCLVWQCAWICTKKHQIDQQILDSLAGVVNLVWVVGVELVVVYLPPDDYSGCVDDYHNQGKHEY